MDFETQIKLELTRFAHADELLRRVIPKLVHLLPRWRAEKRFSLKELALTLRYSPQYLCDVECGRRAFTSEFAQRLYRYLEKGK